MKQRLIMLVMLLLLMGATNVFSQNFTYYVKTDGSDVNDGKSWGTAFATLTKALEEASGNDVIYVAKGTYKPGAVKAVANVNSELTGRDATFWITKNVEIYGGFDGEMSPGDRKPENFGKTILSGDLDGSGGISDGDAYRVVTVVGKGTLTPILDNLVITGGNAVGDHMIQLYSDSASIYQNNGGGIYTFKSSPKINNVTISGNKAEYGGGICTVSSSPKINNVTISGNKAEYGGGIYSASSNPVLTNVVITGNEAGNNGGGMLNRESNSLLINVTITGNEATDKGGGIYNWGSAPIITNSIIWGNTASDSLNVSNYNNSTPIISYSLVKGCGGTAAWNTAFGADGGNNIDTDPLFVDTIKGDYRLQAGSPAINTGYTDSYNNYSNSKLDLGGNVRIQGGNIDMGAYEYETIHYVDANAPGDAAGSPWESAYTSLTKAIAAAKEGDAIYVKEGTYTPDTVKAVSDVNPELAGRNATFLITKNVRIYGGFAGTETSPADRDPKNFSKTILSGDLGTADSVYHVVTAVGTSSSNRISPVLDGLVITGGKADVKDSIEIKTLYILAHNGGGMYNRNSDATLTNVTIHGNRAVGVDKNETGLGGGMYNYSSNPTLTKVTITGNEAVGGGGLETGYGGGMYNKSSSPTLTDVEISHNRAVGGNGSARGYGGGMYNSSSSSELTRVTIIENKATNSGGGVYNFNSYPVFMNVEISGNKAKSGGGIYTNSYAPVLVNVTINGNEATENGGGIYSINSDGLVLTNVTISGNKATEDGGGFYNVSSSKAEINNSIIWGNSAEKAFPNVYNDGTITFSYSLVEGSKPNDTWNTAFGTDGGNNIDGNPRFVDASNGDYSLAAGSPAINAGSNKLYGASYGSKDFAGNTRIQGSAIDMGAYERPYSSEPALSLPTLTFLVDEGIRINPNTLEYAIAEGEDYTFYMYMKEGFEMKKPYVTINDEPVGIRQTQDGTGWVCRIPAVYSDQYIAIVLQDLVDNLNPEAAGIMIYSAVDGLVVEVTQQPTIITVYTVGGQAVAQQQVKDRAIIALPKGIYIVRTDKGAIKARVR